MKLFFLAFFIFTFSAKAQNSYFPPTAPIYACDGVYETFQIITPWSFKKNVWSMRFQCTDGTMGFVNTNINDLSVAGVSVYYITTKLATTVDFPKFNQPCNALFSYCNYQQNDADFGFQNDFDTP